MKGTTSRTPVILLLTALAIIAGGLLADWQQPNHEAQQLQIAAGDVRRGAAGGSVAEHDLLGTAWWYNWGVWSATNINTHSTAFIPLVNSYYNSAWRDQAEWEAEIRALIPFRQGGYWLIGNEPDRATADSDGWATDGSDFAPLMESYNWAIGLIRSLDPSAKIIIGGFGSANTEYAQRMKNTLDYPVDGWHFHLYNYPNTERFRQDVTAFVDWAEGEVWLTEWGVLVGSGQEWWMRQTLPIIRNSALNRYAWFKVTTRGWESVPLALVKDGQLTELGKIYASQATGNATSEPAPTVATAALRIEAETGQRGGNVALIAGKDLSACQGVRFDGGSVTIESHITKAGRYLLWTRVKGRDWGSDSVWVSIPDADSKRLLFDFGHAWDWKVVRDRGEGSAHWFTLQPGRHAIIFETREAGAMLDVVKLGSPHGDILTCSNTSPIIPTVVIPTATPGVWVTPTAQTFTLEQRVGSLEAQVAELQAQQAELWAIVVGQ